MEKVYDYSKLRGKIVEKYGTIQSFIEHVNLSRMAFHNKLGNKSAFTIAQSEDIARALDIPREEFDLYFYCKK